MEEKKEFSNNLLENEIVQDTINANNKEKKSTGRKEAGKINNVGGRKNVKKHIIDKRLNTVEGK